MLFGQLFFIVKRYTEKNWRMGHLLEKQKSYFLKKNKKNA